MKDTGNLRSLNCLNKSMNSNLTGGCKKLRNLIINFIVTTTINLSLSLVNFSHLALNLVYWFKYYLTWIDTC